MVTWVCWSSVTNSRGWCCGEETDVPLVQGFHDPFLLIQQCFHHFFISESTCVQPTRKKMLLFDNKYYYEFIIKFVLLLMLTSSPSSPLRCRNKTTEPHTSLDTRRPLRMWPGTRAPRKCRVPVGKASRCTGVRVVVLGWVWPGPPCQFYSTTLVPCRSYPRCSYSVWSCRTHMDKSYFNRIDKTKNVTQLVTDTTGLGGFQIVAFNSPPETERLRPFPGCRVLRTGHGYLSGVQLDKQQSDDVNQKHEVGQHRQTNWTR